MVAKTNNTQYIDITSADNGVKCCNRNLTDAKMTSDMLGRYDMLSFDVLLKNMQVFALRKQQNSNTCATKVLHRGSKVKNF